VLGVFISVAVIVSVVTAGFYLYQRAEEAGLPNDPVEIFEEARASERGLDAKRIADAIFAYTVDNKGQLPAAISSEPTCIGSAVECVSLEVLVREGYLRHMPTDPFDANSIKTAFMVYKRNDGRIVVEVIGENNQVIKEVR